MAQKRTRKRVNEATKPVAGNKKQKTRPMQQESVDKFQQMLEYLVNEDTAKAEDIFHEIVVERSRQIYENLLAEELEDEEVDESDDEEVDESDDEEVDESDHEEEDDDELEEDFDLDEFEVEADDDMDMMGGDAGDDMEMDMGDEEGDMDMDADMDDDAPVTQDDIKDLEAELADLKAEFEQMLAGDEEGDMDMDMGDEEGDMDMGDEEGDMDMGDEEPEEESFAYESFKSNAELMREYVNKIGGNQYNQFGKMGDNGANTKSPVAGKNDMGGTAQNILRTDTEAGVEANKGNLHGSALSDQNPKNMSTKNVNVPGAKSATKMSNVAKGHGAEKKGSGDTAPNKKPIIGAK